MHTTNKQITEYNHHSSLTECLVEGVGMQTLRSAHHGRHGLHCSAHDVVVGVLLWNGEGGREELNQW